MLIEEDRAKAV